MTVVIRRIRQVARQVRYENRSFWRTPAAAFFTIAFPLMMLLIFATVFGNDLTPLGVTAAQFYAPALAVFGAVSAAYTSLAIGTAIARDQGVLKRVRGTPLPPWAYMAARVGTSVWLAALSVGLMLGVGVIFYDLQIRSEQIPTLVMTFVVGVAAFAALGLAVTAVASAESVSAITNATLLPLAFISGVFFGPDLSLPRWLEHIADFFPLKHFVEPFVNAFIPGTPAAIPWTDVAWLGGWAAAGIVLALMFFRWDPRPESTGGPIGRRRNRDARATV